MICYYRENALPSSAHHCHQSHAVCISAPIGWSLFCVVLSSILLALCSGLGSTGCILVCCRVLHMICYVPLMLDIAFDCLCIAMYVYCMMAWCVVPKVVFKHYSVFACVVVHSPVCSGSPPGPLEACLPFTMCTAMAVRGGRIASASALLAWSSSASGMTSAGTLSSRSRPHRR